MLRLKLVAKNQKFDEILQKFWKKVGIVVYPVTANQFGYTEIRNQNKVNKHVHVIE